MKSFTNPKYLERYEDVVFDLEQAINEATANNTDQERNNLKVIADNSGEVTAFDWYNVRIALDFKVHLRGSDELMLTRRKIAKIKKSLAVGTGTDIKISRTQIRRSVKHGGNLFTSLVSLGAKLLPFAMRGVSKVAPALATGAASALGEIGINKLLEKE